MSLTNEMYLFSRLGYSTLSHYECAKHTDGEPGKPTWGDFPADLATRFRDAMEKLERLCYAIYGSVPARWEPPYFCWNWFKRVHPRCLWGPEQWAEHWKGDHLSCIDYGYEFYELGARGESYYSTVPKPVVPSKSRSGDPMRQRLDADLRTFDRDYFPIDSVTRSGDQIGYDGRHTYDPKGFLPVTWLGIGNGLLDNFPGENVEITYTPPSGKTVLSASLFYRTGTTWNEVPMSESGGVWRAEMPTFFHNATVYWYIRAEFEGENSGETVVKYDPGGDEAPTENSAYSFVAYTHWSPYPHGLPEVWEKCKHGTDYYEFSADETIQPELINLARFVIDYIASETVYNPENMSGWECCMSAPVSFRWSGSAPWPHYVSGGKSGVLPLTGRNEDNGLPWTRLSWRGADNWWGYGSYYGPGGSWLSPLQTLHLAYEPAFSWDSCEIYWTGRSRGLQRGDVIDVVHLEEIISAVNFLVSNGIWIQRPVKWTPATPNIEFAFGFPCGKSLSYNPEVSGSEDYGYDCFQACCESCVYVGSISVYDDGYNCVPYTKPPDWATCNSTGGGPCYFVISSSSSYDRFGDWFPGWRNASQSVACGLATDPWIDFTHSVWVTWEGCFNPDPLNPYGCPGAPIGTPYCDQESGGKSYGWMGYVCGPERNPQGGDALHGNAIKKFRCTASNRNDGVWTNPSMGNYFKRAVVCGGSPMRAALGSTEIGLESVTLAMVDAPAREWAEWGGLGMTCDNYGYDIAAVAPALSCCPDWYQATPMAPYYRDMRDYHQNGFDWDDVDDAAVIWADFYDYYCSIDYAWAEIDLNLDKNGMPTLRDYECFPDPSYWDKDYGLVDDCPCATWTSTWGSGGPETGNGECV